MTRALRSKFTLSLVRSVGFSLFLAAIAACGRSEYHGAAVTGGAGVVAAGVNRSITGDCWARCPAGTRCDRERGLCVDLPCRDGCPAGKRCKRLGNGYECVYDDWAELRNSSGDPRDAAAPDD